jgi:hypothetical protein
VRGDCSFCWYWWNWITPHLKKVKQWWSTIPPISTKRTITPHLKKVKQWWSTIPPISTKRTKIKHTRNENGQNFTHQNKTTLFWRKKAKINLHQNFPTVMVNNSTNINKTNNHPSPLCIEHKTGYYNIWRWKSRSWLWTDTKLSCSDKKIFISV